MAAPQLANGSTVGIGSLPHRDLESAIEFALDATVIPTIPTLPKRSPAEGMVVQADARHPGHHGRPVRCDLGRRQPHRSRCAGHHRSAARCVRRLPRVPGRSSRSARDRQVADGRPGHAGHGVAARRRARATSPSTCRCGAVRSHLQHLLDAVDAALPGLHAGRVHRRARHGRRHRRLVPHRSRHGDRSCLGRPGRDRDPRGVGAARVWRRRLGVAHLRRTADPVDAGPRVGASPAPATCSSSSRAAASSPGVPC